MQRKALSSYELRWRHQGELKEREGRMVGRLLRVALVEFPDAMEAVEEQLAENTMQAIDFSNLPRDRRVEGLEVSPNLLDGIRMGLQTTKPLKTHTGEDYEGVKNG